ncbi:MAG: heat-inducible transcriptional repressor HrcA, partial [Actinobacteria bacterium]|nr:heat-inducible transcriptional repressor HrcA [Actinomycetota bacterium]NIS34139.1 heat-inducible transcriptional repressor HrcA [Actinomycetota bacterium]NIT97266.1 heat-inducible transcriptional repressor HrcA [Actinomycetota bacterium]NIU20957.1 heat-inducible transcriptional repressor HrcA [Actinomycetota bacterium]NIU68925.1 heat-inducible transcriptional repressor HrcA [Actinomycetota bacterium]
GHTIRDIRLLGVEPGVLLLVIVTDGGRVHQTMIRLAVPVTPEELARAQAVVESELVGSVLADDAPEFAEADQPAPVVALL